MPLQPKPERQPPDSVMCLDCTVCRSLTQLTGTRAGPIRNTGVTAPACICSHCRTQTCTPGARGEVKGRSVDAELLAPDRLPQRIPAVRAPEAAPSRPSAHSLPLL